MDDRAARDADPETVLIVGAGMSGLALALALDGSRKRVVLIERDAEPPDLSPLDAFEHWKRPGVSQFRYSHVFVGRLQTLLRRDYPGLFRELEQAGLHTSMFWEGVPPALRDRYVAEPGDERILSLHGRRATFEYIVRRYVARLPHVRFVHGATAQGLLCEHAAGKLRIVGVEIKRGAVREVLRGGVIVDAGGRNSPVRGWLEALGGKLDVHERRSDFAYFCRHYKLRDGEIEPDRSDVSADLDFLKYATFFAERGHFAIAFGCAEEDVDLIAVVRRADSFDDLCRQIPGLARWISRAEPVSKVLGAARIVTRWTRIASTPSVLGLFLTGDAGFEANPIYGRGCAAAFVQSHLLARALVAESDPARRTAKYEAALLAELQPYHRASMGADQLFHSRARRARGQPSGLVQRLRVFAFERVLLPALHVDMVAAREILNVMSMGTPPGPLRIVRFVLRVMRAWIHSSARVAPALPPSLKRAELLGRVVRALQTRALPAEAGEVGQDLLSPDQAEERWQRGASP